MIVSKPLKKKKRKTSRYTVLCIIMGVIFTAIILKLLYIQVFNYQEYKEKADVTSTRFVADKAPRGKIYDDKGNILATNIQTYTLTYTKTEEADKQFYSTMKQLFKILDENNETMQDILPLKIDSSNNIYFEYTTSDKDSQNAEELRFKKDRGLSDTLKNKMFKDVEELSDEQSAQLDSELLKITPEDSFYGLVRAYNLIELVDPDYNSKDKKKVYSNMSDKELTDEIIKQGYSLNDIRKFMVVKDSIKMQSFKGYRSVTIAGNININTSLIVRQKLSDLPGINVDSSPVRKYPYDNLASSVLGYVSSIDDTQKENYELKGYDVSSDLVGKTGIEAAFEEQLKGVKGGNTVKVNSQGRVTQNLFELESYPGNNVHLTIDRDIQYAAEQGLIDGIKHITNDTQSELDGHRYLNATRGALVAVEVKTGRILALVSYPNFDPNLFAVPGQITSEQKKQLFYPDLEAFGNEYIKRMGINKTVDDLFPKDSTGKRTDPRDLYPGPTYNYATMSNIPPGSTFKPLTAIAGLESGVITPDTVVNDTGVFNTHPEIFGKGYHPYIGDGGANGPTNLKTALEKSINFYFYETATQMYIQAGGSKGDPKVTLNSLANYAWQFGLGVDPSSNQKKSTGIEIGEIFGNTYNFQTWKEDVIASSKFSLVDCLEKGEYSGRTFISFDFRISDNDNKEVEKSKKAIKDKVTESLSKVGTDDKSMMTHDQFAKSVKPDILNIMEHSDKYKQNVESYEASTGKKANLDAQATTIADAIAQFTINDQVGQITTPGSLVNASIGQGSNRFSPLQLVSYISTFANGGTRYKIHLVDKITDNDGNVVQEFKPEVLNTVSMSESTRKAVMAGMEAVNNSENGTGGSTFVNYPIRTAGKTGTADYSQDQRDIGRDPYATYVSYAPADDPEIAVVAVVFDGGHGSNIAPAVKAVYDAYFNNRLLQNDPDYAKTESYKKYVLDNPYNKTQSTSQDTGSTNNK